MDYENWKARIKEGTLEVGTYKPAFDDVIDALAVILQRRDEVKAEYDKDGRAVVIHVNKGGNENTAKNPLLTLWLDLNTQALAYWKELGLTPSGLKKINEELLKKKKTSFGEVLKNELLK